jgi:anti-sigma-K factor RskA
MIDEPIETPEERDAALAGEYVLRLLPAEEAAACAAREATDPRFAAEVAAWRADLEELDGAFAEAAPPAGLERRIEARLFGREPSGLARLWASVGLWRAVAAAAVLAALWVGVLSPPARQTPGVPPAMLVSALASVNSDVELLAVYEPQAAVLNLNRTSGTPAPGRSFELWLIEGGQPPVSLGVLPDTALARVPVSGELAARLGPGAQLAVSDEQAGGSTTGVPGEVVALGEVARI